jgi:hypothetical protein
MIQIKYPEKKPSIKMSEGKEIIFCLVRKKWFQLTPEEWVRQNFLLYLNEILNYPLSLMAVEKQITVADVKRRFDIVVYNQAMLPLMLVECKEMEVPLSKDVLHQALHYNSKMQTKYLILTNGNHTIGFEMKNDLFVEINEIGVWGN